MTEDTDSTAALLRQQLQCLVLDTGTAGVDRALAAVRAEAPGPRLRGPIIAVLLAAVVAVTALSVSRPEHSDQHRPVPGYQTTAMLTATSATPTVSVTRPPA